MTYIHIDNPSQENYRDFVYACICNKQNTLYLLDLSAGSTMQIHHNGADGVPILFQI